MMDKLEYEKLSDALKIVNNEIYNRSVPDYATKTVDLTFAADLIEDKIDHSVIKYFIYSASARTAYKDNWYNDDRPRSTFQEILVIPAPCKYLADIYCGYYTYVAKEYEKHREGTEYHKYNCYYCYNNYNYLGCTDKVPAKDITAENLCKLMKEPIQLLGHLKALRAIDNNSLYPFGEFYKVELFRELFKNDSDRKLTLLKNMKIEGFDSFRPVINQIAYGYVSLREEPLMAKVDRAFKSKNITNYFITSREATALSIDFDTTFNLILESYDRFNKVSNELLTDYSKALYAEYINNDYSLDNVRHATEHMYQHMFRRAEVLFNTENKVDENAEACAEYVQMYSSSDTLNNYCTEGSIYKIGSKTKTFKDAFSYFTKNKNEKNALTYNDYFLIRWGYGRKSDPMDLAEYTEKNIYSTFKNMSSVNLSKCIG